MMNFELDSESIYSTTSSSLDMDNQVEHDTYKMLDIMLKQINHYVTRLKNKFLLLHVL